MIYVTSLFHLPAAVETVRPSRVMSLMPEEEIREVVRLPDWIPAHRHLIVDIHDITVPAPDMRAPEIFHIGEIVAFFRDWHEARQKGDEPDGMVIHCRMGVSRSTAAAYIGLCLLGEEGRERDIARYMRQQGPHIFPNILMVELADDLLGRKGRMADAIRGLDMGTGINRHDWITLEPGVYEF